MAICGSGGAESKEGDELGGGRVGRYGAQDRTADSEDEVEDTDPDALESCCIRGKGGKLGEEDPPCILGVAKSSVKQKEQASLLSRSRVRSVHSHGWS